MGFLGDIVGSVMNSSKGGGARKGAEESIDKLSNEAYNRGKMTDAESEQYSGSFDIGKLIEQVYKGQVGLGKMPEGYATPEQQYLQQTGEIGKSLYDTTLADLKDPYATYESQLNPALKAAEDFVNTSMQRRGLLKSGLNIESMGRAGVDLAIKEAQDRMAYRSEALTRGAGMADTIQSTGQTNLANISNLYNTQQGYGQNAMARQAGQALGVLPTQVAPQMARLGDAYAMIQTGRKQQQSAINTGADALQTAATGGNFGASLFGG